MRPDRSAVPRQTFANVHTQFAPCVFSAATIIKSVGICQGSSLRGEINVRFVVDNAKIAAATIKFCVVYLKRKRVNTRYSMTRISVA